MSKEQTELLPCPFCGSDDVSPSSFDVKCSGCGAAMPGGTERAIEAWNLRTSPPPSGEAGEPVAWRWRHENYDAPGTMLPWNYGDCQPHPQAIGRGWRGWEEQALYCALPTIKEPTDGDCYCGGIAGGHVTGCPEEKRQANA